ncbi:SNF2 family N-terminal domain [uncultured Clostridium sp.]|jgi:SNF2 family DNA or RNA helicase|nr:SNF2 family N-terminal domain [uncultured Clostridium sp.]
MNTKAIVLSISNLIQSQDYFWIWASAESKTVITLSAIRDLMLDNCEVSKALVIAPLRVARDTWPAEAGKWDHLEDIDVSVIVGDKKTRIAALNHPAMVYVINRENVKFLVEYYEKNGLRWDFDAVIIDELSSFKNHQSQRFKWLRKVRPFVKRMIGLTGTPTSNGLMDLWAEIGILDGGERLGRFIGRYREAYFKAGSMNPQTGVVFQYVPRPGAEEQIYGKIADITISMKAMDYLHMPDCVPAWHYVEMDKKERKLYDMLRKDLIIPLKDADIDAANAASLTGKLLQMANGAVYDENSAVREIHQRKLEKLEDLIEAANGQSVLVAYWFKHDRQRIVEHLSSMGYKPRDIKESKDIRDWNGGNIQVALIHPASAGHGLNIQSGGHILIWFGLTWSLELYQQTNARLWRQGQTDVVTIHHIICKDTVDEDVMAALEQKDITQEKLIAAVKARLY